MVLSVSTFALIQFPKIQTGPHLVLAFWDLVAFFGHGSS